MVSDNVTVVLDQLCGRLNEYYIPVKKYAGTICLVLEDYPKLHNYYQFQDMIIHTSSTSKHFDTKISLSLATLKMILSNPESFEERHPVYQKLLKVEGNVYLMHYFAQLLKRPDDLNKSKLINIRSKEYLHSLEVRDAQETNIDVILNALTESYPLLIVDAIKLEAMNWSLKDLNKRFGRVFIRNNVITNQKEYISDIINSINDHNTKRIYTNGYFLPEELEEHFKFLPYFDNSYFNPIQMWLGKNTKNNAITKLHCDFNSSFLAQIWGIKTIYLYSPDQYRYLNPCNAYNNYQPCFFDSFKDHCKYLKVQKVDIEPGNLLIIPIGWYHCAYTNGITFSISRMLKMELL